MTLLDALDGQEYIIKQINTDDEELNAFLFSLGCYVGEPVTVVSHLKGGCVVSIKDGRYISTTSWPRPSRYKASPHNCVCGLRPIFCPIRAVIKGGNTYSIPALL